MKKAVLLSAALSLLAGCTSRRISHTPRSAIEQLLLSGAVDKAMMKLELPELKGRKVYTNFTNLNCYDKEYVRAAARTRVAELGGVLVEKSEDAELTVEFACGGLGTEFKESVVGLPAMPVPNSPVGTPEAPVYREEERTGIVKLLVFVHAKGKFVSARHYYAKADRTEGFTLGLRHQPTDEIREGWNKSEADRRRTPRPTTAPAGPRQPGADKSAAPKAGLTSGRTYFSVPSWMRRKR